MKTIFVLWLFMVQAFPLGTIPMTTGWIAVFEFASIQHCAAALNHAKEKDPATSLICLPRGSPPNGVAAAVDRMVR